MELKDRIIAMLKENTGMSFMDSGGAYGRNWERNQKRDFEKEPACSVECSEYDGEVSLSIAYNIFHYLNNFLDYDDECEKLNKDFTEFCDRPENDSKGWLALMEEWCEKHGFSNVDTTNTYNYDNLLSQVIQYTTFSITDDEYDLHILLQIHGGCDVRGGYTKPVIFKIPDRDYFIIAQSDCYADAVNKLDEKQGALPDIDKPKERYNWNSDDNGYHWYVQDGEPELSKVLRCKDGKPFVEIGGKLLPLEVSVMESY